jgi:hypothetical protein
MEIIVSGGNTSNFEVGDLNLGLGQFKEVFVEKS